MAMPSRSPRAAVIGAGSCTPQVAQQAEALGRALAALGVTVVTGGLGGVMEAVSKGAAAEGGHTIGILPGHAVEEANAFVHTPIATGIGIMRNAMVVMNADVVVAMPGEWGTLSELALAQKMGKVVVVLGNWGEVENVITANDVAGAVLHVKEALARDFAHIRENE